ncbi:RHS repeat-associated protein [Ancylobacter aquaticus]|uniref:RHS repeat-associated protein n=1 Tax=Ancylobacter aquaticus TaxID=100 RepID=A0A4R1H9H4_ANCAQ|nr:RHS repeat-associated protein [Ancylobacter aquaticus]
MPSSSAQESSSASFNARVQDAGALGQQPVFPSLSLPKGGGAVRGIGETFSVNPATGTGRLALPLPLTSGRGPVFSGLSLSYDSGAGNGPLGLGWSIGCPAISRGTDRGLPTYLDPEDGDEFVLSGSEALVRTLDGTDQPLRRRVRLHGRDFEVSSFRPRTEGAYARIELWCATRGDESFWRVIDPANITSIYGDSPASRIADPTDPRRCFSWLLSRVYDDKGNLAVYDHVAEDDTGVDLHALHEQNRDRRFIAAQRHLKSIRYSAGTPWYPDLSPEGAPARLPTLWRHQVVLDYGDHDPDAPHPAPDRAWAVRPDPFSSCRPGFELRSYRRCRRILMFHNFPEESSCGEDCLVRSVDLAYADETRFPGGPAPLHSLLTSVTQVGYRRRAPETYLRRAMPPLEFDYAAAALHPDLMTVETAAGDQLANGIDGQKVQLVDLEGDGRPGILERGQGSWTYRANLSAANLLPGPNGTPCPIARFAAARELAAVPGPGCAPNGIGGQILDLSGDGKPDLVFWQSPLPGLFERRRDGSWQPFQPFKTMPRIDWDDPDLRFIDLTGDGRADIIITTDAALVVHISRGEAGFDRALRRPLPWDERAGPRVLFSEPGADESIQLADMTGDGLSDLVRLRFGEVCYWPNLGHGHFGRRVSMEKAPRFADRTRFDPARLRLADIDGSGAADLLYLGEEGVEAAFNRGGNGFSDVQRIARLPDADLAAFVEVTDLLGTGTAALVWSSPRGDGRGHTVRYIDLMRGQKPHLLIGTRNNLGAETRVSYAPSTRFAVEDAQRGQPWMTRIPFPIHVVERTEAIDHIARIRTVTRLAYHHGHYDGEEREFAGFGLVEQWDSDEPRDGETAENWDTATWSPPVLTRSWFHTGALVEGREIAHRFAAEAWCEPSLRDPLRAEDRAAMRLSEPVIPPGLSAREMAEATRALRGTLLRSEVYAQDGSSRAGIPYTVTETSPAIVRVQPRGPNRSSVFAVRPRESLTLHYERDASDPRCSHELTLETDRFGNALRTVSVAYPRRPPTAAPEPSLAVGFQAMLGRDQGRVHITASERRLTEALDDPAAFPHAHRLPLVAETMTAAITGAAPAANRPGLTNRFSFEELDSLWASLWTGAHDEPAEQENAGDIDGTSPEPATPRRRVLSRLRTRYRRDDFTGLLPPGKLEPLALSGENWELVFTPELLAQVYGDRIGDADLQGAGYVQLADHSGWWRPSGRAFLSPGDGDLPADEAIEARAHFFLIRRTVDPFGSVARIHHAHDLMPDETVDPVGNSVRATIDWRVMQPFRTTDPNGNRVEVAFDALCRVVAIATRGDEGNALGGDLTGFEVDPDMEELAAFASDPAGRAHAAMGKASSRVLHDVFAYFRTRSQPAPTPCWTARLARERHAFGADPGLSDRVSVGLSHCDGFAREIQVKSLAEPGPVTPGGADVAPRWTCTGWTVFDNKGRPLRTYEPFFTGKAEYEPGKAEGVGVTTLYDPLGRPSAVLMPDKSWTKAMIGPWRQEVWDANDTTAIPDPRDDPDVGGAFVRLLGVAPEAFRSWRQRREAGEVGATAEARAAETDAAAKAHAHGATPDISHFDVLGEIALTVTEMGDRRIAGRTARDAAGRTLAVFDARLRRVTEHGSLLGGGRFLAGYDFIGRPLFRRGMDDGERRLLPDIRGNAVLAWDAMGHRIRHRYDALGRPTHRFVARDGVESLRDLSIYGETAPAGRNLRGRLWRAYDAAGLSESEAYDFAGNLLSAARHLARGWRVVPDWAALDGLTGAGALDAAAAPLLAPGERYVSLTRHDALGRAVQIVVPHREGMRPSVIRVGYGDGGLAETMDVWVRQPVAPDTLLDPATANRRVVRDCHHDAKGQRAWIRFGNGVELRHEHDPETFRLRRLTTDRGSAWPEAERLVQELTYAYDPVGNVTRVRDGADRQNAVYFRNRRVEPGQDFTYDAAYRLVAARGREHLGQTSGVAAAPTAADAWEEGRQRLPHPGDGLAMGTYLERYEHDDVGNIERVSHTADTGSWTRDYRYDAPSLTDAAVSGDRLTGMSVSGLPDVAFAHDGHGRMSSMPHLSLLLWDEQDHLVATARQAVNAGTPETTRYIYAAGGERVRKVTDRAAPADGDPRRRSEVIALGPIEIRRDYAADGTTVAVERETLHLAFGSERVAIVETRTAGVDPGPAQLWRYTFSSHQGSVSLELDEAGAVISFEEYFPFGGTSYQAVRSQTETPKRYRFLGRERDEESGLYHLGARYYAPWLGRWTSPDPAGLTDGSNRYAYAGNDPIGLVDPGGLAGRRAGVEGDIGPHGSQGHSGGIDPATGKYRLESEHIWPVSHQRESLRNPATGQSPIPDGRGHRADRRSPTAMVKEAVADTKTGGDLAALNAAKSEARAGGVTAATAAELTPEAGLRRLEAASVANGSTLSAGAEAAVIGQVDSLHTDADVRAFSRRAENNPLVGATTAEIDAAVNATPSSGQLTTIATEQKPRSTSVFKGNAEVAAAATTEAKVLAAGAEGLEVASKTAAKSAAKTGAKTVLKKLGTKALKVIPFVGMGAGATSAAYEASQGNMGSATLDVVGLVPVVGDVVDAGRLGVAVGEAADQLLGISDVAAEHGAAAEGVAKRVGLSTDNARIAGAVTAGLSAITVAPTMAVQRTVTGWFH